MIDRNNAFDSNIYGNCCIDVTAKHKIKTTKLSGIM